MNIKIKIFPFFIENSLHLMSMPDNITLASNEPSTNSPYERLSTSAAHPQPPVDTRLKSQRARGCASTSRVTPWALGEAQSGLPSLGIKPSGG